MNNHETLIAAYLPFLQRVLSPARLNHSLGVTQMMAQFSEIYSLDPQKAFLAGLLHDAAKDLSPDQQAEIIAEAGLGMDQPWDQDYNLYQHGPVGAYYVFRELEIRDPVILDAITMHTYCGDGKAQAFTSPLVWCLRFSDILEPNRRWNDHAHLIREGEPRLRRLALGGHLDEAALFHTELMASCYREWGIPIHPNVERVIRAYRERLGPGESL